MKPSSTRWILYLSVCIMFQCRISVYLLLYALPMRLKRPLDSLCSEGSSLDAVFLHLNLKPPWHSHKPSSIMANINFYFVILCLGFSLLLTNLLCHLARWNYPPSLPPSRELPLLPSPNPSYNTHHALIGRLSTPNSSPA
jgi:hypothetical protein